jgi:hypothetical protein
VIIGGAIIGIITTNLLLYTSMVVPLLLHSLIMVDGGGTGIADGLLIYHKIIAYPTR